MANYASEGYLFSLSQLLTRFSLAPPGGIELPSPFAWGDPGEVRRRFESKASSLRLERRTVVFSFPSLEDGWEFWERTNPPLLALKTMLPPDRFAEVQTEAAGLMRKPNRGGDGRLVLDSEYLSVFAQKR